MDIKVELMDIKMDYQGGYQSSSGGAVKGEIRSKQQLAEKLHKPITIKLK